MYKFTKELWYGDEGPEVTQLQERIIEIKQQRVFDSDGKTVLVLEPGDYYGDMTRRCVESIKAKALDIISLEYISRKFKEITGKQLDPEWLEVNDHINPLFGLLLTYWDEVQDYLGKRMESTDLTVEEEPEPEETVIPVYKQLIEKNIEIALKDVGVREATGNNDGPRIEELIRIGSNGEIKHGGPPYCQYSQNAWLWLACQELGIEYKATFSGYTVDVVLWAQKKEITTKHPTKEQIKRGMLGYVHSSSRLGGISIASVCHVFKILGTQGTNVITVEGNTNNQGGSEGNGIFQRIRSISQVWSAVDIPALYR